MPKGVEFGRRAIGPGVCAGPDDEDTEPRQARAGSFDLLDVCLKRRRNGGGRELATDDARRG